MQSFKARTTCLQNSYFRRTISNKLKTIYQRFIAQITYFKNSIFLRTYSAFKVTWNISNFQISKTLLKNRKFFAICISINFSLRILKVHLWTRLLEKLKMGIDTVFKITGLFFSNIESLPQEYQSFRKLQFLKYWII